MRKKTRKVGKHHSGCSLRWGWDSGSALAVEELREDSWSWFSDAKLVPGMTPGSGLLSMSATGQVSYSHCTQGLLTPTMCNARPHWLPVMWSPPVWVISTFRCLCGHPQGPNRTKKWSYIWLPAEVSTFDSNLHFTFFLHQDVCVCVCVCVICRWVFIKGLGCQEYYVRAVLPKWVGEKYLPKWECVSLFNCFVTCCITNIQLKMINVCDVSPCSLVYIR